MKTQSVGFRVCADLNARFTDACKVSGVTASEVFRAAALDLIETGDLARIGSRRRLTATSPDYRRAGHG